MRTILLIIVLLCGCASPCMKKITALEQKQCKWQQRHDRTIGTFVVGTLVAMTTVPNIGWFVLSGDRHIAKWVLPTLIIGWGVGGIGMVENMYIQDKYPREDKKENK